MIFKTRNNWEGAGRHIKILTQGFFVVITPNTWCRESPARVEPVRCSDKRYLAHFFEIDPEDKPENISFFNECKNPPIRQKVFLEGISLQDNSKQGDLFVNKPPILNSKSKSEITWIRIGEEGQKKPNLWSCNFKPAEKNIDDVLKDRYGHFFLRAYNEDIRLIDSTQFRYYGDLSEIQINGQPYNPKNPLPPPRDGYKATRLEFIGTNDQLLLKGEINPSKRDTVWTLKSESGKGEVKVVINLPRIRWQVCPMNDDNWSDKPIMMTRERFQHLSQSGTKLQLQVPLYIKKVTMGFNEPLDQIVSTQEGISLASFVDHQEIDLPQSYPSHLQFAWNDITVTAITIQADKSTNQPSPRYLKPRIRPIVTSNRGLSRQGRGFSRGELELADVDITGNVPNIYIDRRRRTVHQTNVKALKRIYQCHK